MPRLCARPAAPVRKGQSSIFPHGRHEVEASILEFFDRYYRKHMSKALNSHSDNLRIVAVRIDHDSEIVIILYKFN